MTVFALSASDLETGKRIHMKTLSFRKNDRKLKQFAADLTESLQHGEKYKIPGFGIFTTCSRKSADGEQTYTIAMFRASSELRDFSQGGSCPDIESEHSETIVKIISGMSQENGIQIPGLGIMAFVSEKGKTKIIFNGNGELNEHL